MAAVSDLLDSGRDENLKAAESESVNEAPKSALDSASGDLTTERRKSKNTIDLGSADEAVEENEDGRLRSMKRRSRSAKMLSNNIDVSEQNKEELVYGGDGRVPKEGLDNMVNELEGMEKRRAKYRRRRTFDEDRANINFINEGNRIFNRTLDKYFDKFESVSEIKDNIERGTA